MILKMAKAFKTDAASASNDQAIMRRNAHHRQRLFQAFIVHAGTESFGLVSERSAFAQI